MADLLNIGAQPSVCGFPHWSCVRWVYTKCFYKISISFEIIFDKNFLIHSNVSNRFKNRIYDLDIAAAVLLSFSKLI